MQLRIVYARFVSTHPAYDNAHSADSSRQTLFWSAVCAEARQSGTGEPHLRPKQRLRHHPAPLVHRITAAPRSPSIPRYGGCDASASRPLGKDIMLAVRLGGATLLAAPTCPTFVLLLRVITGGMSDALADEVAQLYVRSRDVVTSVRSPRTTASRSTMSTSSHVVRPTPSFRPLFALTPSAGITVYDYLLTLRHEAAIIWVRRPTAISALLLSIRWTMVMSAIASVFPGTPGVRTFCYSCHWDMLIIHVCI